MGDGSPLTNQTPATVALTDKACPDGSVRISSSACSLMQGTPFSYRLSYKVGSWVADQSGWVAATTKSRGGVTPTADGTPGRKALGIKWDEASDAVNAYQEYTVERSTRSDHGDAVTIAVTGARTAVDRGGVAPTKSFTEVTSGFAHTCAILSGQLYCWGANGNGQLGLNDKVPRSEPTVVPTFADKTVTAVSAGAYHTCAIADDLSYCWGLNGDGQVGDGTTGTDRTVPVLLSTVVATGISAGAYHSCGIATGNAVYCWGRGTSGQLGNGASGSSSNPVGAVGALAGKTITAVTAGTYHSCAITSVGLAYCWGEGLNGKLGTGNVNNATSPVAVVSTGALNGKSISRISAGEQHTCAIANALAYCWGSDASGQLGNGAGGSSSSPAAVSTAGVLTGVTALSVGRLHSCAVATGKTYCWGEAGSYQLGNASATDQQTPVSPTLAGTSLPNATATDVGGGWSHTCTIADGDLYCWGLGTSGQLGNATSTTSTSPAASISKARCGPATSFGDGTCSLAPGVKYYYRVTYTLDGNTSATGSWNDVTTSP